MLRVAAVGKANARIANVRAKAIGAKNTGANTDGGGAGATLRRAASEVSRSTVDTAKITK
jgi:hypothetical protein